MRNTSWIVAALAAIAAPAASQESPPVDQPIHHTEARPAGGGLEPFDVIDHDADGFLSWEEIRNQVVKIFHDGDLNGSGALDSTEGVLDDRHQALADMNHDGKIMQRELVAFAAAVFGGADLDNDERLSRQEATDVKQKEGFK